MRFLSLFQHTLGFTRSEATVIIILATTFLIGLALRWFDPGDAAGAEVVERFDYSASDSTFLELSRRGSGPPRSPADSVSAKSSGSVGPQLSAKSVNLNTATKTELLRLPGIGQAFADRILRYREEHGGFRAVGELKKIKGIGQKRYERLLPSVTTR